jgi:hypothetical protein
MNHQAQAIATLSAPAARMLAVEILLADPEAHPTKGHRNMKSVVLIGATQGTGRELAGEYARQGAVRRRG